MTGSTWLILYDIPLQFSDDWVGTLNVWERIVFRARLLQQKLKYKIDVLERQRKLKLERILAHTELLSPRYNQEIMNRFHPPEPQEPIYEVGTPVPRSVGGIIPYVRKEEPKTELVTTGTKPSITRVRSMPLKIESANGRAKLLTEDDEDLPPQYSIVEHHRPQSAKVVSKPIAIPSPSGATTRKGTYISLAFLIT